MKGQENNTDLEAAGVSGRTRHLGPKPHVYIQTVEVPAPCSSRSASRSALLERNSRPSSAATSYGELHILKKKESYICTRAPVEVASGGELALIRQETELQRSLQQNDIRLQQLRAHWSLHTPIINHVIQATGQGCNAVISHTHTARQIDEICWTTRSHRMVLMESNCILELKSPGLYTDVCIRMTFPDASVVPETIKLSHAASATSKFLPLGEIRLEQKSLRQLRHLFRLGKNQQVQRMLQITCTGWLAQEHAGMHRVSNLFTIGKPILGCSDSADVRMEQFLYDMHEPHKQEQQTFWSTRVSMGCTHVIDGRNAQMTGSGNPIRKAQEAVNNLLVKHDLEQSRGNSLGAYMHYVPNACTNCSAFVQSSPAGWQPNPLFGRVSACTAQQVTLQEHGRNPAAGTAAKCELQPACGEYGQAIPEECEPCTIAPSVNVHGGPVGADGHVAAHGTSRNSPHESLSARAAQHMPGWHDTGTSASSAVQPIFPEAVQRAWVAALPCPAGSKPMDTGSTACSHTEARQSSRHPSIPYVESSALMLPSECTLKHWHASPPCTPGEVTEATGCKSALSVQPPLSSIQAAKAAPPPPPFPLRPGAAKEAPPPSHLPSKQPKNVALPPPPTLPLRPGKPTAAPPVPPPPPSLKALAQPNKAPLPPPPPAGMKKNTTTSSTPAVASGKEEEQDSNQYPTPKKPMVKLFWAKLPNNQVQGTVWDTLHNLDAEVDYSALEEGFAAKATVKAAGGGKVVPSKVTLLPVKLSEIVGVFLRKLKMSPQKVRASILKLLGKDNPRARDFSDDEISGLLSCLPTADEKRLLNCYKGPVEDLAAVEQFMLEVQNISSLELGLRALRLKSQFEGRSARVQALGDNLLEACDEIQSCTLLAEVLKVSLLVGNFLNAGNKNGAAVGFQIDALLKLKDVKSTRSRSSTLLHFIAREVARRHSGDSLSLKAGLPSCKEASKLSLTAVQSELAELSAGLNQVKHACSDQENPGFQKVLEVFHAEAQQRVDDLEKHISSAKQAFSNLGSFLNGQRSTMREPSAFFGILQQFSEEFDAAHLVNVKADEAAAKQQGTKKPAVRGSARMDQSPSPLRQRDRMLSDIRVFSRLRPEQSKELLTEKGAVERVKKLNLKRRHSMTMERPDTSTTSLRAISMNGGRPHPDTSACWQVHSIFMLGDAASHKQGGTRSRPTSPSTVRMPPHPTSRPGSSPGAFHLPGKNSSPACSKKLDMDGSESLLERQRPAEVREEHEAGTTLTSDTKASQADQQGRAAHDTSQAFAPFLDNGEGNSAREQTASTAAIGGTAGGALHLLDEIEDQQLAAVTVEECIDVDRTPPLLNSHTPQAYGSSAVAADAMAKLQLSMSSRSPAAVQDASGAEQACGGSSPAITGQLHQPSSLQQNPSRQALHSSSQRSLTVSPSSTPLGAMGRRSSSGFSEPTATPQGSSTSPAAGVKAAGLPPVPVPEHQDDLQPQPSLTPEGVAHLQPVPAVPVPDSPAAPRPLPPQLGDACTQQGCSAQEALPPIPSNRPSTSTRHARRASCEGAAALNGLVAPKPRKRVTFSLPSSPQRAITPCDLGTSLATTPRDTLEASQLAYLLGAARRPGSNPTSQQHQAGASGTASASRLYESMESLPQSVPTARAFRRRAAIELWGVQEPCPAGRISYDRAVESAMAAVIASAGGSPSGWPPATCIAQDVGIRASTYPHNVRNGNLCTTCSLLHYCSAHDIPAVCMPHVADAAPSIASTRSSAAVGDYQAGDHDMYCARAGPLGQGFRAAQPGHDTVEASIRASWNNLCQSAHPEMPQPLGEGVRESTILQCSGYNPSP